MDEVIIVGAGIGGLTLGIGVASGEDSVPDIRVRS